MVSSAEKRRRAVSGRRGNDDHLRHAAENTRLTAVPRRIFPFLAGPLTLDSVLSGQIVGPLSEPAFEPIRIPKLSMCLEAPRVPEWNLTIPPFPGSPQPQFLGFVYDHVELQPGAQSWFPIGGQQQDVFILTMPNVYRLGPDDGAHSEADLGVQIGAPFSSPKGPWTFNPFVRLTDVDRLGTLGAFHWWQPYAQAGFQFSGLGNLCSPS